MEEKAIAIVLMSSIFVMVALFVINYVIYFKRKKETMTEEHLKIKEAFQTQLLQSRIEVQEQTFQQIGKELHDNVGQLLSTSRMLIGLTEREMQNPPDTLLTANATLGQAIHEIRSLAKSLDKEWLERFSFAENIQTLIERINAGSKVDVEYLQSVELPLRSDEQIILFRIVQEAIQNAIKHASPAHMRIAVTEDGKHYFITVSDDGRGFDAASVTQSMGISNMQHRTQLLSGSILFNSIPGRGTTVSIRLPVKSNEL